MRVCVSESVSLTLSMAMQNEMTPKKIASISTKHQPEKRRIRHGSKTTTVARCLSKAMEKNNNNCDKSHTSNDLKGLYVNPWLTYTILCCAVLCCVASAK